MRTSLLTGQSEEGVERHPLPSSPLSKDTFRGVQWVALPIHHCICHDRISDIKHLHDCAQVVYLFNRYLAQRDSKDQILALLFAVSFFKLTSVNTARSCLLARWFPRIPWRHLQCKINAYYMKSGLSLCDWPDCALINDSDGYTNWQSNHRWQFLCTVYDFIREDDGYFECFRIYFTLHVWRERMSEECKSQLSTRSQKGLTVLCQLAWGNDVYFDSWEFNTQIWCKTQTIKHNICPTS